MIVKVTRKHIKNGKRGSETSYPIALALRGMSFKDCEVNVHDWYFKDKVVELPKEARAFIKKFDDKEPVEPFSFRTVNLKKAVR